MPHGQRLPQGQLLRPKPERAPWAVLYAPGAEIATRATPKAEARRGPQGWREIIPEGKGSPPPPLTGEFDPRSRLNRRYMRRQQRVSLGSEDTENNQAKVSKVDDRPPRYKKKERATTPRPEPTTTILGGCAGKGAVLPRLGRSLR